MHPRIHSLIPTILERESNPELVYSDHLPVVVEFQISEGNYSVSLISLNTRCTGEETPEAKTKRYERIIGGLDKSHFNLDYDVIALQEVDPALIVPLLKEKLKDKDTGCGDGESECEPDYEWEILAAENMVTCFRKDKYTCVEENFLHLLHSGKIHFLSLKLKEEEVAPLMICNLSGEDVFPWRVEEGLRDFVSKNRYPQGTCIILGDFKARIAPLKSDIVNIATSVELSGENVQMADYSAGAFAVDIAGNFQQLETKVVNFNTGYCFKNGTSNPESRSDYRMILSLDQSWLLEECVDGKTILEYQEWLREALNDEDIRVSMAANSFNERAICVPLADESNINIRHLVEQEGCQLSYVQDGDRQVARLFVPLDKIEQFHAVFLPVENPVETMSTNGIETESVDFFRIFHNPLANILIGAVIGLLIVGAMVAGAALGGGLPLVFGGVGALFALADAAAIATGIAVIATASMLVCAALAECAGYFYAKYKARTAAMFVLQQHHHDSLPVRERSESTVQQPTTPEWKPEKRDSYSDYVSKGLGLLYEFSGSRRESVELSEVDQGVRLSR